MERERQCSRFSRPAVFTSGFCREAAAPFERSAGALPVRDLQDWVASERGSAGRASGARESGREARSALSLPAVRPSLRMTVRPVERSVSMRVVVSV